MAEFCVQRCSTTIGENTELMCRKSTRRCHQSVVSLTLTVLMPYIVQVASGGRQHVNVYGSDYDTPDGNGVRDYIHLVDLTEGHLAVLVNLQDNTGLHVSKLGAGRGYSVLEVISTFAKVTGINIPYKIAPLTTGNVASSYASPAEADKLLG